MHRCTNVTQRTKEKASAASYHRVEGRALDVQVPVLVKKLESSSKLDKSQVP